MGVVIDIKGMVFGKLTVVKEAGLLDGRAMFWLCKCLCGNKKIAAGKLLRSGGVKSCGCLNAEVGKKRMTTHGCGNKGHETQEYIAWRAMIQRVNSKSYHARKRYDKVGVSICDRWRRSFENFLADMGKKPSPKHSLDRYPDKMGNYEPANCRWATLEEQHRNKENNVWFSYNGKKMILSDWARFFSLEPSTVSEMIKKKRSFRNAYKFYIKKYANRIALLS